MTHQITTSDGSIIQCSIVETTTDGFTRMEADSGERMLCYKEDGEWVQPSVGSAFPWDMVE